MERFRFYGIPAIIVYRDLVGDNQFPAKQFRSADDERAVCLRSGSVRSFVCGEAATFEHDKSPVITSHF